MMMEIYFRNKIVTFNDHDNNIINQQIDSFDKKSDYSEYEKRGQSGLELMRQKNRTGKKGEFFAAKFLIDLGFPEVYPDMRIFDKTQKSWDADLDYAVKYPDQNYPNVHVKSCDEYTKNHWGMSWAFQFEDENGMGKDALFRNPNLGDDMVIFICMKNEYADTAEIMGMTKWRYIKNVMGVSLLELPQKSSLKSYKRFVYDSSIERVINELPDYVKVLSF